MIRIWALIKRIMREMLRDKRTLALLFVAPLFIMTLMYFLFNGDDSQPKLGTVHVSSSVVHDLQQAGITVKTYQQADRETVLADDLAGLLIRKEQGFYLLLQNSHPRTAHPLHIKIKQTLAKQVPVTRTAVSHHAKQHMTVSFIYGNKQTDFFDVLMPILVGFFVFFFVFLISGIGLLKERTSGTLDRLLSTPIKRSEIVLAYLVGFGLFACIQTIIIVTYSVLVLDIVLEGAIWQVIVINLLLAVVALSLGMLLSTFAASEFQMMQFIPIAVVPQVFFSGIFPLENMADWLQVIAKIMPVYYAADALKSVMYKGLGLTDVPVDIVALIIFSVIFIALNIITLKRYRSL